VPDASAVTKDDSGKNALAKNPEGKNANGAEITRAVA
jgi:hypothetical protein